MTEVEGGCDMLGVAAALLAVAAGGFAALYFCKRRNLRRAAKELRELREGPDSNRRLNCPMPDRDLESLYWEIDQLLGQRREERIRSERRERELRQQIANISHDLRTPLTSVLGYTELLREGKGTPEERREYLAVIQRRAQVLQSLITGFYDLSRLEAGEYRLEWAEVDLYRLLCEVMAAFYRELEDGGFQVELALDESAPPVPGDRNALLRVFTNLVRNAVRHGRERLRVILRPTEDGVEVEFSNGAPPMTEEDLAHVFDRFYTADQMRTGQDTGLGLTIARQFVEQMGGRVAAGYADGWFTVRVALGMCRKTR